jgi:phosphoadenosine phosphosulfate reductase
MSSPPQMQTKPSRPQTPSSNPAHEADGIIEGSDELSRALRDYEGRIAVVSSFGAESAVLLALVADRDKAVPVLFLHTLKHFAETLAYQRQLTAALGLSDVRIIQPQAADLSARDPSGLLHAFDADACCALRKVEPLEQALEPFDAWVNGRKRRQAATRAALPVVELLDGRVKINPLAHWDAGRIEAEMRRRDLPRHPLATRGYLSIGCEPCTEPVADGADPRSGRWATLAKTECGIHRPTNAIPGKT